MFCINAVYTYSPSYKQKHTSTEKYIGAKQLKNIVVLGEKVSIKALGIVSQTMFFISKKTESMKTQI